MPSRFEGSVEPLCQVDVKAMVEWISAIALADWPQQNRPGQPLKPAMMTDLDWHGFDDQSEPIVREVMTRHFGGCGAWQRMLSVVMPGDSIPRHRDQQAPYWLCRVHVPLKTNTHSDFIVDGEHFQMEVGTAYRVNTMAEHSVVNDGASPRIHFMFDVRSA